MSDHIDQDALKQPKVDLPWYKSLQKHRGALLLVISLANCLDIINVAAVTIALPSIQEEVGYKPTQLQWVVSAYSLAYAAFLLMGGRLGDLLGHRRVFILGTAWFAIWSLVVGFSKSAIFMSISRAIQGMGAGFTIPSALALLTTNYAVGPERTRALSLFAGAACIGLFVIPEATHHEPPADRRIDLVGMATFTIGIVTIVYYLSEGPAAGFGAGQTVGPLAGGVALLAFFVWWELRIPYPIMPPHIWRSRRFMSSTVIIACITAAFHAMIFFSSLTFQNVLGYTPITTACAYIVHGVGLIVGLYSVSYLYRYVRTKIVMLVGFPIMMASTIIFAQVKVDTTYWELPFVALLVNCIGLSPTWLTAQVNSVTDAKDEDQGVVGSIFNIALQLGGPLGIAISTIIADKENRGHAHDDPKALMVGYSAAFYAMAGMSAVGLLLTGVLAPNQDPDSLTTAEGEIIMRDNKKKSHIKNKKTSATTFDRGDDPSVEELKVQGNGQVGDHARLSSVSDSSCSQSVESQQVGQPMVSETQSVASSDTAAAAAAAEEEEEKRRSLRWKDKVFTNQGGDYPQGYTPSEKSI
ncbi:hypothetical protein DFQ27_001451 [Actinomortierella ambigua]|uniref:Major facilitator superfamily (MFS) profile domain-containing protein n=1 Tax=Actinomortierella ambigua TaxID=1343610 RepID=A0A9P6U8F2_9FUNG|nr:hypothetical protein DFQ27_001451 [Actinomortierella ambigua]